MRLLLPWDLVAHSRGTIKGNLGFGMLKQTHQDALLSLHYYYQQSEFPLYSAC